MDTWGALATVTNAAAVDCMFLSLPNLCVEISSPVFEYLEVGLLGSDGYEGTDLMNGISALTNEALESSLASSSK